MALKMKEPQYGEASVNYYQLTDDTKIMDTTKTLLFFKIATCFDFVMSLSGTAIAQWLRCYATNRMVAGSIPDGVIGMFH